MARRTKIALLSFMLVLVGTPVVYVLYVTSVENPLRIRLVGTGMETLNKEPYSKDTYVIPFYFEVENTAPCAVHLEYMWLYADRPELEAGENFPPPLPGRDKVSVEFKLWATEETMMASSLSAEGAHVIPAHGARRFELMLNPLTVRHLNLDSLEFEYHWSERFRLLGYRLRTWAATKLPERFRNSYIVRPLKVGQTLVEFTRISSPPAP